MKESFVFHAEFISDLPEEYKARFAMYAINYGLQGEEPSLDGLEHSLWLKIKRRIDSDKEAWEETKNKRSEAGKIGGIRSAEAKASKAKQDEATSSNFKQNQAIVDLLETSEAKPSKAKQDEANQAVNVNDSVNVNESVSVYVYDGVNVSVEDSDESTNATILKINQIQAKHNLDLTKNQINRIASTLSAHNLDDSFLDYVCEYLLNSYKKIESGLFFKASTAWDNLRADYIVKPKQHKIPIPDFTICPECNAELTWIGAASRFCSFCRKDYVYKNKSWRAKE